MDVQTAVIEQAEAFVAEAYGTCDDEAGLAHARAVGALIAELGCEERLVVTALLHDVVEDTAVTPAAIEARFGTRVAELVAAMSEDEDISDDRARKQALRASIAGAGHSTLLIFAADKLARVRAADQSGAAIEPAKLEHYRRSLEMFITYGLRSPHVAELDSRLALRRTDRAQLPV